MIHQMLVVLKVMGQVYKLRNLMDVLLQEHKSRQEVVYESTRSKGVFGRSLG